MEAVNGIRDYIKDDIVEFPKLIWNANPATFFSPLIITKIVIEFYTDRYFITASLHDFNSVGNLEVSYWQRGFRLSLVKNTF